MEANVKLTHKDRIGRIYFSHPKGNSLPSEMLQALINALEKADRDPNIGVVVLESRGNAFCAGASLAELKELRTVEAATVFFMGFARLINALRKLSKFVLARVHGKVVGGGVGLVAACDAAYATPAAQIKLSELSIGIGPYVIEPALSRKIGPTAFAQLSLDSHQWKSADWGLEKGLYAKLFDEPTLLDQALNVQAQQLASYPPQACHELRKLHWKDTKNWETLLAKNAQVTGQLALSDFTQKIIQSL
jgi:methylglutaconyl-CoA hydratase